MQRAPTTCYFHDLLLMTTSSHSQHLLPTVIPTGAGRRFFSSFVRERVGLRSGGISLRSLAQAKPPRPFKRHPEILRARILTRLSLPCGDFLALTTLGALFTHRYIPLGHPRSRQIYEREVHTRELRIPKERHA